MNEPSLVTRNFQSCEKLAYALAKMTCACFWIAEVASVSSASFSSSGTVNGSRSCGVS